MAKVVVIGLDGVSWDLLMSLAQEGSLPTFEYLMRSGAYGRLESTFPPLTCPAWFSFSTGKNPGKLGIYNFFQLKKGGYEVVRLDNDDLKDDELWDILSRRGYKVGIVNNPIAYPPKEVNGYMVAGFFAPSERSPYAYPNSLKKELNEVAGGYVIDVTFGDMVSDENVIKNCYKVLEKRFKVIFHFIKSDLPDFFLGVFTTTDRICHQILNKACSGDERASRWAWGELKKFFNKIDGYIKEILSTLRSILDEDFIFMVFSDHGFTKRTWGFYINQWLINEGYLKLKKFKIFKQPLVTRRKLIKLLSKFGLVNLVKRTVPRSIINAIPRGPLEGEGTSILDLIEGGLIDWENTKAVAVPGGIYINTVDKPRGIVGLGGEYEKLRDEIINKLENIQVINPETNKRLAIEAYKPEELYSGSALDGAPDIMLVIEGYAWGCIWNVPNEDKLIDRLAPAHHNVDGVFFAYGPSVKEGVKLENLKITDITPTILHVFGLPVPGDMDGRVMKEMFKEGSDPATRPVKHQAISEKGRIKKKILRMRGGKWASALA